MLKCFDVGSYAKFSQLWERAVPLDVQRSDPMFAKLDFYCNLHFAVLPFRDKGPNKSSDDVEVAAARAAKAMAVTTCFMSITINGNTKYVSLLDLQTVLRQ